MAVRHAPSAFLSAVRATEICMAFRALTRSARATRCNPVVDAIGGTSVDAHWRLKQ
jgi:hypothetical protein